MAVLLTLPLFVLQRLNAAEDHSSPTLAAPAVSDRTVVADARAMPAWAPSFINPSVSFVRHYVVQGRPVGLYVGYYRGQGPGRKLVSSSNSLVASGDNKWIQPESGTHSIALRDKSVVVKTARLRRPVGLSDPTTLVAWQVYWVNGRFEASDARAKVWGAWQRLSGRGDDGAVIVVHAQEQQRGDADAALEDFVRNNLAAIEIQLRKTRDGD